MATTPYSTSTSTPTPTPTTLTCKLCQQPITFDSKHIGHVTGRKIPLDVDTGEPHNCPARKGITQQQQQPQQRRYLPCSKGCGHEIYFDVNSKTSTGKWIPLDKQTRQPHECSSSQPQQQQQRPLLRKEFLNGGYQIK
jgi:hypothetical protein